jgi:chemotaxis protein methyltransferase CheR
MVLSEYAEACRGFSFSVLGTDVSSQVLKEACEGIYPEAAVEPVPLPLRKKYLLRSRNLSPMRVRMAPEIRARVRFGRLNFMEQNYGLRETFHVIFFRNVMIYFEKPTQQLIVNRLCRHLEPGGYFFISHSETLMGVDLPLKLVTNSVFRKT